MLGKAITLYLRIELEVKQGTLFKIILLSQWRCKKQWNFLMSKLSRFVFNNYFK